MPFVQPMRQELIKPVSLALIILLIVAMATTAGLSQPKSIGRAYKGSLECERMTDGVGVCHVPVSIVVGNFRGTATVTAVFDFDERPWSLEIASGTVGPDGEFRLGDISYWATTLSKGIAGVEPDRGAIPANDEPIAVVFDLMNPIGAGRWF